MGKKKYVPSVTLLSVGDFQVDPLNSMHVYPRESSSIVGTAHNDRVNILVSKYPLNVG